MTVTASILIPPQAAYDIAREMRGKQSKPLTPKLWGRFIRSEHSPIRVATYRVKLSGIPYWVSVHLTRHKVGVEHFVTSRREDITGNKRTPEDIVDHIMVCNAQALISMARKRLCFKAADETRELMLAVKSAILELDAPMSEAMVADCVYRDRCYEMTPCAIGYPKSGVIGYYDDKMIYYDHPCPHCGAMPYWKEAGPGHVQVCARCKQ